MKMQINSTAFGAVKIAVSPVTLYTKHYRHDEMEIKSTNHHRLASRKGGVWKIESLSESFGSR